MQERTSHYTLRPCDARVLRDLADRLLRRGTLDTDLDPHAAAAVDMISHCAQGQSRPDPRSGGVSVTVSADHTRRNSFCVPGARVLIRLDDTLSITWDEEDVAEPGAKRVRREGT